MADDAKGKPATEDTKVGGQKSAEPRSPAPAAPPAPTHIQEAAIPTAQTTIAPAAPNQKPVKLDGEDHQLALKVSEVMAFARMMEHPPGDPKMARIVKFIEDNL